MEQWKLYAIIFSPLWIMVFYDLYLSRNSRIKKTILMLVNLALLEVGSLLYLAAAYLEGEHSIVLAKIKKLVQSIMHHWNHKLGAILLLEILFVTLVSLLGIGAYHQFQTGLAKVEEQAGLSLIQEQVSQGIMNPGLTAMMESTVALLKSYLIKSGIFFLALLLIILLLYTSIKCWQWSILTGHALTRKHILNGIMINTLLFVVLFLFLFFFFWNFKQPYAGIFEGIACVVFLFTSYHASYFLARTGRFSSLWKGIRSIALTELVIPYTFFALGMVVLATVTYWLQQIPTLGYLISALLFVTYFAIVKGVYASMLKDEAIR